jgi:flagella basal body P-ring formation protein FlgA
MAIGLAPVTARTSASPSAVSPLRPQRRVWLLLLSLIFVVVCAGAFALVYLRADTRAQALAVAQPVAAGQQITVADLRVVRVSAADGIRLVPAATTSEVIGRTAVVPLAEGSLLSPDQFGPSAWPPTGP